MTRRIAVVACSQRKLAHADQAQNIYTGTLFARAREYAERKCDYWVILSAKHGLLLPTTWVEPYDNALSRLNAREHETWCRFVNQQAYGHFLKDRPLFVLLAGELYRAAWEREDMPNRLSYEAPLRGLGLGRQLAWFTRELGRKEKPIPIVVNCPRCTMQHVDRGEFAQRAHRTHRCEHCGHEWRPANVATIAVTELPG